ncbi:MAG: hypothetical protein ACTHMQ_05280 [Protaetiibacter sp.]
MVMSARVPGIEYTPPEVPAEEVYSWGFESYEGTTYPADEVVYSTDFESANPTADGWNHIAATGGRSGSYCIYAYDESLTRTVTGLVVGRSYTLRAWIKGYYAGYTITDFGITGDSAGPHPNTTTSWVEYSKTFVATATSHQILVSSPGYIYMDDVSVTGAAYSDIIDDGKDGQWSGGTVTDDEPHTGTYSLARVNGGSSGQFTLNAGLPVEDGLPYTVTLWARVASGTATATLSGNPLASPATSLSTSWTQLSYSFTASGTTEPLYISWAGAGTYYFDDVVVTRDAYTETLDYLPLQVAEGVVSLDDNRAPYAEAELTVHMPAPEYASQIDPREGLRVEITAALSWDEPTKPDQTRDFDLYLDAREIDHAEGTLLLTLHSDEAILIDGAVLGTTVDDSAEDDQDSLRAIINGKLATFGATLEAGDADADYTITTNRTNLALNPRGATATTAWAGSNATISRLTGLTIPGLPGVTTAIRGTMSAATGGLYHQGDSNAPYILVTAGKTYRITAWLRASVAKTVTPSAQWSGATPNATAPNVSLAANTWTKVTWTVTVPAGATRMGPYWYSTTAWASGNTIDATGLIVTEGTDEVEFFDGAWSDTHYTYAWTGTANNSSSTRTRLDNRSVDLLKQEPGQTFWDFLDPLVRTAGLRLFCDEQRAWRLVERSSYSVPGEVRVSEGTNATRGLDIIDLHANQPDGTPVWVSGYVVKYSWTDSAGVAQVAYDSAGTGENVYRLELTTPYPGPGLAASRLAQATGRGRVQDLEALADLTATPGQMLVSTLPGTPIQTGTVSAVTWHWAAEGDAHDLMDVRSRALTDTPPGAWVFADGTWSDVSGIDWADINEEGE